MTDLPVANRSIYAEAQVLRYLERINFPQRGSIPLANFKTLGRLIACHLSSIPWENVTAVYAEKQGFTLDKDLLFDKLVNQNRGGCCLEKNGSFATLLSTLGYEVYFVVARVWIKEDKRYPLSTHVAMIVNCNSVQYLVDVGFADCGLTAPLPIFDGKLIDRRDGYRVEPSRTEPSIELSFSVRDSI